MKCPKCKDSGGLFLEEESSVRGKIAGLACKYCGFKSGILYDYRKRVAEEGVLPLIAPEREQSLQALYFSDDDWAIVQEFAEHPDRGAGEDLAEDVASLLLAVIGGNVKFCWK